MFADDTNISLSAKTLTELKQALSPGLSNLSGWLKANKLSLSVAKTGLMIIVKAEIIRPKRWRWNNNWRSNHQESGTYQILGVTIDVQLTWCKHIEEISKKVSSAIGALKRVLPFISKETAIQIYNALILPHFDYCSPVWDCFSGCLSDKLQKLKSRAVRVITKLPFDTNSPNLLSTLNWVRLSIRRKKKPRNLMTYKTMNGLAPEYLQRRFAWCYSNYNLRNSEGKLALPKPRTNYLKRSFSYSRATLWNNLPNSLKTVGSIAHFKRNLKKVSHISVSHTAIR